jgi:hypothetical protein
MMASEITSASAGRAVRVSSVQGPQGIVALDQGFLALEQATTVLEIKRVRDGAEAVRQYAQNARLGLEIQNRAAELKLCAERKAGHVLMSMSLRGGNRRSKSQPATLKLDQLGVTKHQSWRWQLEASVPERDFKQLVQSIGEAGAELTSAVVLRYARQVGRRVNDSLSSQQVPISPGARSQADEIVDELSCHCRLLNSIIAPIYESGDAILLKAGERKMLRRLLGEFGKLLHELKRELARRQAF